MRKLTTAIVICMLFFSGCAQSAENEREKIKAYRNDVESLLSLKSRLSALKRDKKLFIELSYKDKNSIMFLTGNHMDIDFDTGYYNGYSVMALFEVEDGNHVYVEIDENGKYTVFNVDKEGNYSKSDEVFKDIKDFPGISLLENTSEQINAFYKYLEQVELNEYLPLCHCDADANYKCELGDDSIEFHLKDDDNEGITYTDNSSGIHFTVTESFADFTDPNFRKCWFGYSDH
ncbi:hypothetical protein [Traorella massiliensis]|uniref:hypothetical protein n=1 Tax=Traorella massiliensis TaxID=1903263 RepID=UPI00248EEEEB|nr:hypothetical protein [Traorella massiliensis]